MIERYRVGRGAAMFAAIGMVLGQLACGPSAPAPARAVDVRGSWEMLAVADGARYPQTLRILTEDLATMAGTFTDSNPRSGTCTARRVAT